MLHGYLRARAHALRWAEERIRFKNDEIVKPRLAVDELRRFTLGVNDASAAAVDFLRLDHAVDLTDWISRHLQSARTRMATGRTLPVRNVVQFDDGRMAAELDLDRYELSAAELQSRAAIGEGSFVRISPHSGDPQRGQTIGQLLRGGRTCRVETLDWATGRIDLQLIPGRRSRYTLQSFGYETGLVWERATIDESPSDFVAGRADDRLTSGRGPHAAQWFDPLNPQVPDQTPLPPEFLDVIRAACESADFGAGRRLSPDQVEAVIGGLGSRVQLLQGPPGTGKTQTTSASVLVRSAARLQPGSLVLIAANTHTAVDTLARRLYEVERPIRDAMEANGIALPPVQIARAHTPVELSSIAGRVARCQGRCLGRRVRPQFARCHIPVDPGDFGCARLELAVLGHPQASCRRLGKQMTHPMIEWLTDKVGVVESRCRVGRHRTSVCSWPDSRRATVRGGVIAGGRGSGMSIAGIGGHLLVHHDAPRPGSQSPASGDVSRSAASWRIFAEEVICGLGGWRIASRAGEFHEGKAWPRSSQSGSSLGTLSPWSSSSFSRNVWRSRQDRGPRRLSRRSSCPGPGSARPGRCR